MQPANHLLTLLITVSLLVSACGSDSTTSPPASGPTPGSETRSFYMGFTPWPYAGTTEAVNTTYAKIQENGDIIDHQFMQGIPWNEAFNQSAYPSAVEADIQSRLAQTRSGKAVFLAIDSLNGARNALANNWGSNGEEARPAPWDSRDFNSQEVIDAYTRFALDMIGRFKPLYFNYATEASELIVNDLAGYTRFKAFARAVYSNIKAAYPDLKLTISVAMKSPGSNEMTLVKQHLADILPYVDVIGVSVYPYAFYFDTPGIENPARLPDDWLSQITQIAPGKPVVITETGWIAEPLVIDAYGLDLAGSEEWQRDYVKTLLAESEKLDVEFIIWWSLIDFQSLWENELFKDNLAAIWRDIGLYDEQVKARAGLGIWREYYQRPRK